MTELFADQFETVFFADGALFARSASSSRLPEQDRRALQVPFADLLGALEQHPLLARRGLMGSTSVSAVIVGASRFQPPSGLGSIRSDECYLLTLSEGTSFDLRQYFSDAPIAMTVGVPVWTWEVKYSEDRGPVSFYAAQLGSRYVIVSNELKELNSLAARILSGPSIQTVPGSNGLRRAWQDLSKSLICGYRRYGRGGSGNEDASGASLVGPRAEGLFFTVRLTSPDGYLKYFGSDQKDRTSEKLEEGGLLPRFKGVRAGLWETHISLSGDERSREHIYTVMCMFGFGVYL